MISPNGEGRLPTCNERIAIGVAQLCPNCLVTTNDDLTRIVIKGEERLSQDQWRRTGEAVAQWLLTEFQLPFHVTAVGNLGVILYAK